ncbi:MAG TPA: fibronectin type III domain-containing protein [Candidatus Acidoferrum sp.]|nr:fibronectin type III domain-containing protein [Candidatus Acidoferrum sp.]
MSFRLFAQSASDQLEMATRSVITGAGYPEFTVNPPGTIVNTKNACTDFGLSQTGSASANSTAMANAISWANGQSSPCEITIPQGTYVLNTEMNLGSLSACLIDGQGSQFLFNSTSSHLLYLNGASKVQIQNLSVGFNWTNQPVQSLAYVLAATSSYMDLQYVFEGTGQFPNWPNPPASATVHEIVEVANTGGANTNFTFACTTMGVIGEQNLNLPPTAQGSNVLRFNFNATGNGVKAGMYCAVRHFEYEEHGIEIYSSSDVTFSNVNVYSTLGMGYQGWFNTRLQVINSKLTRPPVGSAYDYGHSAQYGFSGAADGFNMANSTYVKFENNEWAYTGDDAINIHDNICSSTAFSAATNTITVDHTGSQYPMYSGNTVELHNADLSPLIANGQPWVGTIGSVNGAVLTFSTPLPGSVPNGTLLFNDSEATHHYIVRNNSIHQNKVRGLLTHCADGTIQDNSVSSNYCNGMMIACVTFQYEEGFCPSNIIVRGNVWSHNNILGSKSTFSGFMNSDVSTFGVIGGPTLTAYPICQDILFEYNTIDSSPYAALQVNSATNVVLYNNIIQDPCQKGTSYSSGSVEFINDGSVVSSNNSQVVNGSTGRANICTSSCVNSYVQTSFVPLTLPAGWTNEDIGHVDLGGGAVYAGGTFTEDGSGADIWGTQDSFNYTYQGASGNCQINAQVASMQTTDPWAKAGLMIRNDGSPDAPEVGVFVTPGNGVTMVARTNTTGSSYTVGTVGGLSTPVYLSLSLSGSVVSGYESSDGIHWSWVGAVTNTMVASPYVGLAVTSKNNAVRNVAAFNSVTNGGAAPAGLAAVAGDSEAILSWNAVSGATNYLISYGTASGGPYALAQTSPNTTATVTGLTDGVTYYFVVAAVTSGGVGMQSFQASATPQSVAFGVPTGLAAIATNGAVALTWSSQPDATSYTVSYGVVSGGPYPMTLSTSVASAAVANLQDGVTYYFVVAAEGTNGSSGNCAEVVATPLAVPGELTASAGNATVNLAWNPVAGAAGYLVSYGASSGGPYVFTQATSGASVTINGLANGTTSYFVVMATNTNGASGNSSEVWATPEALDPAAYSHSMEITFAGYNRATSLTNFPLLVNLGANIPGFAYGQFKSPAGYDLSFTDASNQTLLNYEIDQWNTNGVSSVWVSVPLIASSRSSILAYWGDPAQTNQLVTCTNGSVWTNYAAVFHFKESGFPYVDSTTLHPATSGTAPVVTAAGMVGSGEVFNGTSQHVVPGIINLGDTFSLSAWVNLDPACTNMQPIFDSASGTWNGNGVFLYVNGWNTANQTLNLETGDGTTGTTATTPAGLVSFGTWHNVFASVSRTAGTVALYVDGANVTPSGSATTDFANVALMDIGRLTNGNNYLKGRLDEVRIDAVSRPADWVWASWMNIASNSVFASYGAVAGLGAVQPPYLAISSSAAGLVFTWADQGAGFMLYSTTNLTPPIQWMPVTNFITRSSGQELISPPTSPPAVFYRLQTP